MEILQNIIYYIVPFIILLGVLVFVHEFGHFIIARSLGVAVSDFSIGFGKELWSRIDKHGTKWKICAIPLGGYCQFLGDADASSSTSDEKTAELSEEDKKHAFPYQKSWKKLAIVVAGPAFNYLFAIVVFIGIFYCYGKIVYPSVVGAVVEGEAADLAGIKPGDRIISINGSKTPDFQSISNEISLATTDEVVVEIERPLTYKLFTKEVEVPCCTAEPKKERILGLMSLPAPVDEKTGELLPSPAEIGNVIAGSAAAEAGMQSGDLLDSVNGVELKDFIQLKDYVAAHTEDEIELTVRRPLKVTAVLRETSFDTGDGSKPAKRRMLGIQSMPGIVLSDDNMTFGDAVKSGCYEAYDLTVTTLRAVGQMITGQRGGKDVGGIIRIAELSGDVSKTGGLIGFIYFMALLSVNLGLINILPVPVLDGGHVVIYLCEMITRRELKPQVKDYIFKFGLLLILAIMVLATWNDVMHLINRWFD
ncbi:MAG: RIP metalloprotease RseP [Alphaproteobacteria bacterium]|nr:RIP metalloprotease RseP [Alphaproteobacteria bacterium]